MTLGKAMAFLRTRPATGRRRREGSARSPPPWKTGRPLPSPIAAAGQPAGALHQTLERLLTPPANRHSHASAVGMWMSTPSNAGIGIGGKAAGAF